MSYDAVIAGGSFAGLVLATSLQGRVALVEKGEIGEGQTSACGTTLDLVKKLGLEEAIEEVHGEGVMHTRGGVVRFPLPYAFCTFDYRTFCRLLMERFSGELVRAAVSGAQDDAGALVISAGERRLSTRVAVDATGWRAVLASTLRPGFPARRHLTYGLEQPATGWSDPGLHFYFDPRVRGDGYGWSFPAGAVARAGVLSYVSPDGVRRSTEEFIQDEGMRGAQYHGGYLPAGLRPAVAGPVFLVGDSAGHCLPLTGEGIRPAVFFAQQLAGLINDVTGGRRTRFEASSAYAALQAAHHSRYELLRHAQAALQGWPDPPMGWFFRRYARQGRLYRRLSNAYWRVAAPIHPVAALTTAGA